jgi:hypothetical protein
MKTGLRKTLPVFSKGIDGMKTAHVLFSGFLTLVAASAFGLDSFRVGSMVPVTVDSQKPEAQSVELGYYDALGILFPKNTAFIRGVEIEVKTPQGMLSYQNGMAYGLYRKATPAPNAGAIDYQAEQITLQPLPSRLSFVLQIPLQKNHGLKTGPYSTVLNYVHDAAKGPLVFRLLPVMKGLPDNIESLKFTVRIKPILANEGAMQLKLAYPEEPSKPVAVRVDEMPVQNPDSLLVLNPGEHHLSIVSDDYRNEVRVFTVEPARVTDIAIKMKETTPHLTLVAPANAVILLDGKKIEANRDNVVIDEGNHLIMFKIGDYELTRQLAVEKGRDYTVTMLIDVNVSETP